MAQLAAGRKMDGDIPFQLLARTSYQSIDLKPYNMPLDINTKHSYADEKFQKLQDYYKFLYTRLKEPHNPTDRRDFLEQGKKKLDLFIEAHIKDMKRLLYAIDTALMSMVMLKLNKKMDTSEAKIRATQAKIPFGLYTSPEGGRRKYSPPSDMRILSPVDIRGLQLQSRVTEVGTAPDVLPTFGHVGIDLEKEFKCLGTSYYFLSSHNQEDAQMILSSERRPHCYTFRGAFAFTGFYHRHSETSYVGPHAETFQANYALQGLYCKSDENNVWGDTQCVYKINPREEFPESVEYEPKVSYWCGPYRYFIPATTDIRCIFNIFAMNFVLRFGYDGVTYKNSDLTFMYQNGQVFYTDEPWAGMSCWAYACKWRHNQNSRGNEFFVN